MLLVKITAKSANLFGLDLFRHRISKLQVEGVGKHIKSVKKFFAPWKNKSWLPCRRGPRRNTVKYSKTLIWWICYMHNVLMQFPVQFRILVSTASLLLNFTTYCTVWNISFLLLLVSSSRQPHFSPHNECSLHMEPAMKMMMMTPGRRNELKGKPSSHLRIRIYFTPSLFTPSKKRRAGRQIVIATHGADWCSEPDGTFKLTSVTNSALSA